MCDDPFDFFGIVTQFLQGGFHRLIDNFEHSAACEQLVFYERDVRLNPGRIAIHQETDCARRGKNGDLRVTIAVALPELRCTFSNFRRFLFQMRELFRVRNFPHRATVQINDFRH